ncbi:MAG: type II secretion system secretin GspD [Azoarcus sp.]|jgi:general secretion pathway protein D|nr:type II secretion system secretin GspD [Azoarcus sp.]
MSTKQICVIVLSLFVAGCAGLFGGDKPAAPYTDRGRQLDPDPPPPQATPADETRPDPLLFRGNDAVVGTPAQPGKHASAGAPVSLSFEHAPVEEVVHSVLGDLLKVDYIVVTPLAGEVTLRTQRPVPRAEVIPLLESVLQPNGLALVADPSGRYRVGTAEALRSAPRGTVTTQTMSAGSVLVVNLQYIGAAEMADILRPVIRQDALQRVDTTRNLLLLSGTRNEIDSWLDLIRTFDVDFLQGMSVGLFPLVHTSVREVDAALQSLIGGAAVAGVSSAPATPRGSAAPRGPGAAAAIPNAPGGIPAPSVSGGGDLAGGSLNGLIRVMPIERLNALLIVTPRAHYLELAKTWIERLDRPSDGNGLQLWIYPVQNGSAEHLAALLSNLYGSGGASGAQPFSGASGVAGGLQQGSRFMNAMGSNTSANRLGGGAGFGGGFNPMTGIANSGGGNIAQADIGQNVRVVADPSRNALLIYASRPEYLRLEEALRRLDVAPTQVLIEASIIEVTLGDGLEYGVQWTLQDRQNGWTGSGGLFSAATDTDETTGSDSDSGKNPVATVINAFTGTGFGYTVKNSAGHIRGVLQALAKKSLLNVLSNPNVMVLDNHTATIQVGDQTPVETGSTITDGGTQTTSIQYRDAGVMLTVKPSVNAGDMVMLDVDQSVVDVGGIDVATKQRSFNQRQIVSKVAVRSGETIVLGGLIRDRKLNGKAGVPLLQDIPFIGSLFRQTEATNERTELIVMLTPRVIRTGQDIRQIGAEIRERMVGLHKLRGDAADHVRRLELPPGGIIPRAPAASAPPPEPQQPALQRPEESSPTTD